MSLDRRKFLLLAASGLGAGCLPWLSQQRESAAVTRTSWALGADVSLTVLGLAPSQARRALDAAFAEIETVEQVMSIYRPTSQLSQLNRNRILKRPHRYLLEVLTVAAETSRATGGAFDITVQPLWQLHATAKRRGTLPTPAELAAAQRQVDWQQVKVTAEEVQLLKPVAAITLNGIAQGYALDRALAALKQHGATTALINTGEIGSLGTKAHDDPWTTGIQHPREPDSFVAIADLDGRALATSGDYETNFSADLRSHHIFDPRTGTSPPELASVSIVAPTGLQADALSTAAMVLGKDQALALLAGLPNVDALLITKSGEVVQTAGFPAAAVS